MDLKFAGSILLVVGTSTGAGLLALPAVTAQAGFFNTCLLLVFCWFLMMSGALYLLEVNLQLPLNSNLISMAKKTFGNTGQIITWFIYLLLLYVLLAAYLAGGSDIAKGLTNALHIYAPNWFNTLAFLSILSCVVYQGIRSIDWVNRGFMLAKFITFILLTALVLPHIHFNYLTRSSSLHFFSAVMVIITSFGFAVVIPSIRIYLHSDVKKLKRAIVIGSLIPLVAYILWIFAIQGTITFKGQYSLLGIERSPHTVSELTFTLSKILNTSFMQVLTHVFASICMITSFLGVSLSLSDFLADGLRKGKKGKDGLVVYGTTFLPPLLIVLFFPGIFIEALSYAGILCVILLVFLPSLMAWKIRKIINKKFEFRTWGNNQLILFMLIASILLLIFGIYQIV